MKAAVIAAVLGVVLVGALGESTFGQAAKTIVDEWAAVQAPPPPTLRPVTVDPRTTALLILDIQRQNCNMDRRPRCVASLPRLQALLKRATDRGMG